MPGQRNKVEIDLLMRCWEAMWHYTKQLMEPGEQQDHCFAVWTASVMRMNETIRLAMPMSVVRDGLGAPRGFLATGWSVQSETTGNLQL